MLFNRKKSNQNKADGYDSTPFTDEDRLDTIAELIKDLPRARYNKLMAAAELVYSGYQKVKPKAIDEKTEDLDEIEKQLTLEMKDETKE